MEKCLKDMMDPEQRKKIHDNLLPEERTALKDFQTSFPAENLRIRLEDKGPRFVIADGATEDEMIEKDLQNLNQFREIAVDPKDDYEKEIETWARVFKDRGVDEDIEKFAIKEIGKSHPVKPKPHPNPQKKTWMDQELTQFQL